MTVSLEAMLAELPADRRERIEQAGAELIAAELTRISTLAQEQGRLDFRLIEKRTKRKTDIWEVFSGDVQLGLVEWFTHWRRYVYRPNDDTLYDASCLLEIAHFCNAETLARKAARLTEKGLV